MTKIGEEAFLGCSGLIELSLPDTLNFIGEGAFEGCLNLEVIYCSDKVTELLTEDVISGSQYSVEEMRQRADPNVYLSWFYWNPMRYHNTSNDLKKSVKTLFQCAHRNDFTKILPNMPNEVYTKILNMIRC